MSHQLVYILLGVLVIVFAIVTIRDWAGQKKLREAHQAAGPGNNIQEIALPLKLQAYERLVVFMERIHPENIVNRVIEPHMKNKDIRALMIHSIRSEYDHNVSQQIYVSKEAWDAVSNAKEQLISMINSISEKIDPEDDGKLLGKQLLQLSLKEKDLPTHTALQILNTEAKKLMANGRR